MIVRTSGPGARALLSSVPGLLLAGLLVLALPATAEIRGLPGPEVLTRVVASAAPAAGDRMVKVSPQLQALYQASLNKFEVDELYDSLIVRPLAGFAEFCRLFDQYVIDGIVDLIGHLVRLVGDILFRPMQNGLVQFYALAMVLGLTVFLIALARGL